jgi:hypothetical protein
MSYDLMVFDPEAAPKGRAEFLAWFDRQAEWKEPHSYDDPKVSTARLRAWFMAIIETFPTLNGPYAPRDILNDDRVTDYSVGQSVIYAGFLWPNEREAYRTVFQLAETHGLGFFDASSSKGEVWLPDDNGKLVVVHSD